MQDMKTGFLWALGAVATLAGCKADGTNRTAAPLTDKQAQLLEKELGGKIAGEPLRCLHRPQSASLVQISDDILLYRVSSRLVYRNDLRSRCPGLARDNDIIVTETYGSGLCNGDLIRLVDRHSGIQGPACSLGDFVPYRKAG
jgi:hypothetical protein